MCQTVCRMMMKLCGWLFPILTAAIAAARLASDHLPCKFLDLYLFTIRPICKEKIKTLNNQPVINKVKWIIDLLYPIHFARTYHFSFQQMWHEQELVLGLTARLVLKALDTLFDLGFTCNHDLIHLLITQDHLEVKYFRKSHKFGKLPFSCWLFAAHKKRHVYT